MKKSFPSFLAVVSLLVASSAFAQSEEPRKFFQMHAGIYGSFAPGAVNGFGIGALAEPKIAVHDQINVGVRIDGGALFFINIGGTSNTSAGIGAYGAFLLKGEFRFFRGETTPFVGLGAGYYTFGSISGGTSNGGASAGFAAGSGFGLAPQLGMDLGGFRIAALYHLVFATGGTNFFALELSWHTF